MVFSRLEISTGMLEDLYTAMNLRPEVKEITDSRQGWRATRGGTDGRKHKGMVKERKGTTLTSSVVEQRASGSANTPPPAS